MVEFLNTMSKTTSHIRSDSLPSKSSNTFNFKAIGTVLFKFDTLEIECSLSSASSICQKLREIKKLYEGIENSIQCPSNQQALSLEQHRVVVEEVLDGSLKLLDFYAFINDVLSLMKESMFEFESCIRRKNNGCKEDINAYMMSRKKIHKMVSKYLKHLQLVSYYEKGDICIDVVRMLKEVETISLLTLNCVLAYFARTKGKQSGWSMMAKMIKSKHLVCEKQEDGNELRKIDQIIFDLDSKKTNIEVKMAQDLSKQLASIELAIFEVEECLEAISRCLLKTRVSLLNILSH